MLSFESPLLPLGGEGTETGGHKGYGLALMIELLCGALGGTALAARIAGAAGQSAPAMGHLMGALRVDGFRPPDQVRGDMESTFELIRGSARAPGMDRIYIHGEPEIEVPAGTEEPTELVVQPLIKGAGPVVEAGQEITVQYKGWLFDGTLFDSSWDGDPFPAPIGVDNLIAGWDEGLVGLTVGSQVLLVVPGDKGYGAEGSSSGSIPPNATLIFVVDILDAA